jgi:hypothetical protein
MDKEISQQALLSGQLAVMIDVQGRWYPLPVIDKQHVQWLTHVLAQTCANDTEFVEV